MNPIRNASWAFRRHGTNEGDRKEPSELAIACMQNLQQREKERFNAGRAAARARRLAAQSLSTEDVTE